MDRQKPVNLLNLLLSLSDALDLAGPELVQHQIRTAFIAWEMGRKSDLSEDRLEQLFYAALLHDIGAFSVEEKYALLRSEKDRSEEHCIRGEMLLKRLPWLGSAAALIRHHHRKWKDWQTERENPFILESQILFLADYLERHVNRDLYILHQHENLASQVVDGSGSLFDPDVVDLFKSVSMREEFWLALVSKRLYSVLMEKGPARRLDINFSDLFAIAEVFSSIIDFRSRFTATHSSGVSASAAILSSMFGLTESEIASMTVAGYLHDLGKLLVPNQILEKPDKLTREEFAVMKSHTYYTYSILNSIKGFEQIAEWGAFHHERLDGSGYPFHCKAEDLTIGARIMMVADIFTATAEDRPYRKGMESREIIRILKDFATRELLESKIVDLVVENYQEIYVEMQENRRPPAASMRSRLPSSKKLQPKLSPRVRDPYAGVRSESREFP